MKFQIPKYTPKILACKLRPKSEKKVREQHPWIFSEGILKLNKKGETGDVVVIFASKKNTVLAVGLYDADSPIRIKILHFNGSATLNKPFFDAAIDTAYLKRTPLLETQTNSYRLLFGENDYFPGLIADVYNTVLVVKLYSEIWYPHVHLIFLKLLEVSACKTLVIRLSRSLQNKKKNTPFHEGQVLYGELQKEDVTFKEHGINFSANVIKGHKTGYFLDHRENRKRIGDLSKNKAVLDVFSYAGGFSVHALTGGAKSVTSVDISKQALQMAVKNAALNKHTGKHITLAGDAFEILKNLINKNSKYDIVIIDPPSFAKRKDEIEKAIKSYQRLARIGPKLVKKGGILLMASCSSRITEEVFFQTIETVFIEMGVSFSIQEKTSHDIDHPISFPEGAYLKTGYYKIH